MAENIRIDLLINAAQSAKTIGETKKALKDLKSEALNLKEGSAAFIQVATAAGELQDKISDLSATTQYLGDDLRKIKGISGIGEGIAGGFAMASGAAALFGGENKKLEESMVKLQAIMAVIQGLQAIGNVIQKESAAVLFIKNTMTKAAIMLGWQDVAATEAQTAATVGETVATEGQVVATESATIAQKLLNLAMKANPIGILITLIMAGVAALMLWSNASSEAAEEEKKANEEKKKAAKLLKEQNEERKKAAEYVAKEGTGYAVMADQLKKTLPGSAERLRLIKEINKTYGTTLQNLKDESKFQDQVTQSTEKYMEFLKTKQRLQALGDLQQKNTLKQNELEDKLLRQRSDLQKSIDARKSMGLKDNANDLKIALEFEYKAIAATEAELKSAKKRFSGYGDYSDQLTEKITKNGLKLKDEVTKDDKAIVKSAESGIAAQKALDDAVEKAKMEKLKASKDISEQERKQLQDYEDKRINNLEDGYRKDMELALTNAERQKALVEEETAAKIKAINDAQIAVEEAAKKSGKPISEEAKVSQRAADAAQIISIEASKTKVLGAIDDEYNKAKQKAIDDYSKRREDSQKEWTEKKLVEFYNQDLKKINEKLDSELWSYEKYNQKYEDMQKAKADITTYWAEKPESVTKNDAIVGIEKAISAEGKAKMKVLENQHNILLQYAKEDQQAGTERARTEEEINANILEVDKQYLKDKLALEEKYTVDQRTMVLKNDKGEAVHSIAFDGTKSYLENLVALYEKAYGKIPEIVHDTNVKTKDEQDAADKKALEERQKFWDDMVAIEAQAQELIMAVFNNGIAEREAQINKEYDDKIAKIDAEKEKYDNAQAERTISQQIDYDIQQGFENDKKDAELIRNQEIDAIKKKQFNAQKINDEATIAINTAVAVAAAWKMPYVAPFVIPGILASAIIQAGIVASKQYIPSFATGGLVRGPGTGTSDSVNARLSNGESVINAKSTKLFAPVLSAINEAGGGVAIPHLKNGGIYTAPVAQQNQYMDTKAIVDAIYSANERPIETYVKESAITTAQKNTQRLRNRTSF